MSSVRLLKDFEGKKTGEVVSMPFGKARDMIARKVCEYADSSPPAPAKPTPSQALMLEENRRLKMQLAEQEARIAKLADDNGKLTDAVAKITKERDEALAAATAPKK
jgi:hypothetical protein